MSEIEIEYQFSLGNGKKIGYLIVLDGRSLRQVNPESGVAPSWALLETHKCSHCPLSSSQYTHCPAGRSIAGPMSDWRDIKPYEPVELQCKTQQRTISASTTAQQALSTLIGLKMATSDCPHLTFFRPMARFHTPLSSPEEYAYRAITSFLLAQRYLLDDDCQTSKTQLANFIVTYRDIETVNRHLSMRLESDRSLAKTAGALVILDSLSKVLPETIDEYLKDLRYLFEPYLAHLRQQDEKRRDGTGS